MQLRVGRATPLAILVSMSSITKEVGGKAVSSFHCVVSVETLSLRMQAFKVPTYEEAFTIMLWSRYVEISCSGPALLT